MSLYVFDARRLDTIPGAPSRTFSPPQGWNRDDVEYLNWLRFQFKSKTTASGKDWEFLHALCG